MNNRTANWQEWRDQFRGRAERPLPPLDADLDYTRLPRSLARSMAVFQLGESGGGSVVGQAGRSRIAGIDEDYVKALDLFVAEEHRHANLLAICVRLMGGRLVRRNWTARLFVTGRRLMGLRLKILVLLAAEVVGLCFYRLVATRLPPCRLRDTLLEIVGDEHSHMQFHCAFFERLVRTPLQRTLFLAAWRTLMCCAGLVVLIDHRRTLRDMSIDVREFRDVWAHYRLAVEVHVLGHRGLRQVDAMPSPPTCQQPDLVTPRTIS